ncbi:putative TIR domain, winged helix-turn-helix DNA-binding domain-containing protein [Lupinus albus]|uniref:Putative TIR domain, winged helix-turn-helix DNA-binding domain-containing protein n=1 Tax=Lupinus albus TaxID=3870 RepID=A0A6A4PTW3_LUPAL|nr:putative TIR domain, winged helix-turn-helix DNA-binding domain-containing protein [Lupinus albus]
MAVDEVCTKSKWKYHVFLSFRGEDTRFNFTDHLYKALVRKGIITFRDDEELERGESISQNLLHAIEESLIAIVIISPNYASSTWCLDELQKIVDCNQSLGLQVFPIFYGVDSSHVRHQRGSFEQAFKDHEQRFEGDKEKVQKWRDVLKDVAELSGWDSKNKHESKLIEEIVEEIWTKLEPKLAMNTDGLISIETKVNDLISHLRLRLQDTHLIGIWGMGGIGKTTLADVVFNKIKSKFDFSCFLANVREASNEGDQGLIQLQDKLLSELKPKSMKIDTLRQGKDMIKNLVHNKKVLLVLDDVNAEIQLEYLAGNKNWFGEGSRIIVTTRDKHLLTSTINGLHPFIYETRVLNYEESLLLFCEKAFNGNQPLSDYLELSKKVVEYTGGLPLAIKVYGSLLNGRSIQEWEDILINIGRVPPNDIIKKLKISYDMLEDEYKTIFLNIACFFKGWEKEFVTKILDKCGIHPRVGISVLIEKSLITCDANRILRMHDLLEEMGKNIVIQESPFDLGRRRWLWSLEDIDEVLRTNTGTEKVQGIFWNRRMPYDARWLPDAFSKMCNIRLLFINCDLNLPIGLKCLSSSLKVVIWLGYPLKALPLDVPLDELVHLEISYSKIEKLWNGTHSFWKLEYLNLSNSKYLIETPDISRVPNLKQLDLSGCTKLVKVHYSVGVHKKLEKMSFYGCINLETLPSKMEMDSLKWLILDKCSKLRRLPDFDEKMECVSKIYLKYCTNLLSLPNTISNLKTLKILNISGCSNVDRLPNNINENKALEELNWANIQISRQTFITFVEVLERKVSKYYYRILNIASFHLQSFLINFFRFKLL